MKQLQCTSNSNAAYVICNGSHVPPHIPHLAFNLFSLNPFVAHQPFGNVWATPGRRVRTACCKACGRTKLHVHHWSYGVRAGARVVCLAFVFEREHAGYARPRWTIRSGVAMAVMPLQWLYFLTDAADREEQQYEYRHKCLCLHCAILLPVHESAGFYAPETRGQP